MAQPEEGIYFCQMDAEGHSADREWFLIRSISGEGFERLGLDVTMVRRRASSRGVMARTLGLAVQSLFGLGKEPVS
jgi:hypothetical protein